MDKNTRKNEIILQKGSFLFLTKRNFWFETNTNRFIAWLIAESAFSIPPAVSHAHIRSKQVAVWNNTITIG